MIDEMFLTHRSVSFMGRGASKSGGVEVLCEVFCRRLGGWDGISVDVCAGLDCRPLSGGPLRVRSGF